MLVPGMSRIGFAGRAVAMAEDAGVAVNLKTVWLKKRLGVLNRACQFPFPLAENPPAIGGLAVLHWRRGHLSENAMAEKTNHTAGR
ncbi:MAG: hypothetical protein U0X75_01545 [Acidobacteriota bacterium]